MRPQRIFTAAEEAEIVRLYNNGLTVVAIRKILAAQNTSIAKVLKKHNIAIRTGLHDPSAVPLKTIPGLGRDLSRAERAANSLRGYFEKDGRR